MIVWLSSFPRSGNSLVRMMLSSVFLVNGTERYRAIDPAELGTLSPSPSREGAISARTDFAYEFLGPWQEFRAAAHAAPHKIHIKTHELADDDSRAIYVVRDPRSALVSYCHYLQFHHPDLPVKQEDVIRGSIGFGSWSAHLESWQPDRRRDTLLLRYEDLVEHPHTAIAALAEFTGIPPLRPWRDLFSDLHVLRPNFYRSGSNARNVSELNSSELDLIRTLHGPWMRRLGYNPD